MVGVAHLTESRLTQEVGFWACLRLIILITLINVRRLTLIAGISIPWAGILSCIKRRQWAEDCHVSLALCFLMVDAKGLPASSSFCLDFAAMTNCTLNCEQEEALSPVSGFCQVFYHSHRKANKTSPSV